MIYLWTRIRSQGNTNFMTDIKILNASLYPVHIEKNTPEFMTALYNTGRLWLGAATILPPKHIPTPDLDKFITFRRKCTRYNPPGAPDLYVSGFISHTSHMKLILRIRKDAANIDIAFLMCAVLLDFMAYISYVISKQFHNVHNSCSSPTSNHARYIQSLSGPSLSKSSLLEWPG